MAARELWHQARETVIREEGSTFLAEGHITAISVLTGIVESEVRKAVVQDAARAFVHKYHHFKQNAAQVGVRMEGIPEHEDDFASPRLDVVDVLWGRSGKKGGAK
jgi:hypothetical protein